MTSKDMVSQLVEEFARVGAPDPGLHRIGVNRCRSLQALARMTVTVSTLMIPLAGAKRINVAEKTITPDPAIILSCGQIPFSTSTIYPMRDPGDIWE